MGFQTEVPRELRTPEEVARDALVTVTATMSQEQAEQLAQFAKRSMLDTFYELTEAHLPHDERTRLAYLMIGGMEAVQRALAEVGYSPR